MVALWLIGRFADRHDSERLRGLVTDRQMDGQTFAIVESLSRLKTHNFVPPKEIYKPGVETVLVNGPPIGQHSFSSDLICQRMPPVPTFPPMVPPLNTRSQVVTFPIYIHLSSDFATFKLFSLFYGNLKKAISFSATNIKRC